MCCPEPVSGDKQPLALPVSRHSDVPQTAVKLHLCVREVRAEQLQRSGTLSTPSSDLRTGGRPRNIIQTTLCYVHTVHRHWNIIIITQQLILELIYRFIYIYIVNVCR